MALPARTAPERGGLFSLYWTSATCSYLGDGLRVTALPLLAASLSASPNGVAAVSAAAGLPWLLFGLPAGVLVDRVDRAPLMALLQAVRGVLGVVAVVGVLTGRIGIVTLAVLAFLLGICEVVFDIASHALLPELVSTQRLQWANGRLVVAEVTVFEFVGPLLGGVLFAVVAALPLAVDAATFFVSGVLLTMVARATTTWPTPQPLDAVRETVARQMSEGLRWFARSPLVCTLTLLTTSINLGAGGFYAVLVLFARDELSLGPAGYGMLIAVSALGSVAAGFVAARVRLGRDRRLVALCAGPAIAVCFGLVAAVPHRLVTGAAMVGFGLAVSLFNVIAMSLRQTVVPATMLGRVLSVHRMLCWGALPVGAVMAGAVASGRGPRWAIAACAGAVVLTWLATLRPLLASDAVEYAMEAPAGKS
jgi:MFS family permease